MSSMETGDLILADKGLLIHDMVPTGVSVNIPPFLQHGRFTECEAVATKNLHTAGFMLRESMQC